MKRSLICFLTAILFLSGCQDHAAHGAGFSGTPKQLSAEDEETAYVEECIDAFLFSGDQLPESTPQGSTLEWRVNGNARIEDYHIYKTENAREYEPIQLEVCWKEHSVQFEHLTLLDEAVGYVISYFTSEGEDKEQLKLAYTFNCEYWFKLNNDQGILKPSIGTKRLRDPSLLRKKDGGFALLATQGYDTDSIYIYDSMDLVTFEHERVMLLNGDHDSVSMSGRQAWAPEGFYDPVLDTYIIVWSSPEDGGIFYSSSDDLITASAPQTMTNPGFPVIDITLTHSSNGWVALLKDEREPMESYSQILRGTGLTWASISSFSEPVYDRHQVEGPMIMKSLENESWYVVVDDYTRSSYKMIRTSDIESGTFEELDDRDLMIPLDQPSHASALRVTWKEIERLSALDQ